MVKNAGDEHIKAAIFDLVTVSPTTRSTVSQVLAATLASDEITDEDIEIYVGCTRAELLRTVALWDEAETMSLSDAHDVWLVLVNAAMLKPWRRWVPDLPSEDAIEVAHDELERPIHGWLVHLYHHG